MKLMKKLFGGVSMSWRRVITLSLLVGVVVGVFMLLPFLSGTSLQDMGIYLDVWFVLALFIILNCRSALEAAKKCFVFFLLSQPLIYLVQVPFTFLGWGIFSYYKRWFILTLLTFPGAMLAYRVKRRDRLSTVILSVATVYLAVQAAYYINPLLEHFPHHLLSIVFCLGFAVAFSLLLPEGKHRRTAALLVVAVAFTTSVLYHCLPVRSMESVIILPEGEWDYTLDNADILDITLDGSRAVLHSKENGSTIIDFTAEDGTTVSYCIVVDKRNLTVSTVD